VAVLISAIVATLLTPLSPASVATAATLNGTTFDPGYIISDERFFDSNAMTVAEIQAFLDARVPNCQATDPNLPCLRNYVGLTNERAPSAAGHCTGYQARGYETAAEIIWRVAQSCRINPQVLLVTLQKEQGLVTSTKPTAWSYRAAMGYGCPDTAPCDERFYGFFNQVWMAAWQFRQYTYNPSPWRHRVGVVNVLFHPNSECGSSPVTIRNQATANLYNYTPYQPDAAALMNLYGLGGSCSSYGNRNFWRWFNIWFGSSTANGVAFVESLYRQYGGATGVLGEPTSSILSITDGGGGTAQAFVNGSIYWTRLTGAHAVTTDFRDLYFQYGGAVGILGWPDSERGPIAGVAGAEGQYFTGGSIFRSAATSPQTVIGVMRTAYFRAGGASGALGFPIAERESVAALGGTGFRQNFENGQIVAAPGREGFALVGALSTAYRDLGGPGGVLGWPLSDRIRDLSNGGGWGQAFTGGSVYESAAGAYSVRGAVRQYYWSLGGSAGSLGWPLAEQTCVDGACEQPFQNGTIYTSPTSPPRVGIPAIEALHASLGGTAGVMGARLSAPIPVPQNGSGYGQAFAGGSAYASAAGAFLVSGPVRDRYWALAGSAGSLGWPIAAQTCASGVCQQTFQFGTIYSSASGTWVGHPAIEDAHRALGGASGPLGSRLSDVIPIPQNGGGLGQTFVGGSFYYTPSVGAYSVRGAIRSQYWALGGSAGYLGWPTAERTCQLNGACSQSFQNGWIYFTPSAGTWTSSPQIEQAYTTLGGATGVLGARLSSLIPIPQNGGGFGMSYSGGPIYWSSAGAYSVRGAILGAYWSQNGAAGTLGWPTAEQTCASGTCEQTFQGGTIITSPTGTRIVR
jgi:uncharacterized protein with LGFP repeats